MVMLVVMLSLCGCGSQQKLPARKTDGKIKIGVSVYDQYDAFVSELVQDLNDQVLSAKAEEKQDIVLEVYNAAQTQTKQNEQVRDMIAAQSSDVMALSTEACAICQKCAYPDAPCRHPDRMFPCVESQGILVTDLAEKHGLDFMNGNIVVWFSLILFK